MRLSLLILWFLVCLLFCLSNLKWKAHEIFPIEVIKNLLADIFKSFADESKEEDMLMSVYLHS